MKNNVILLVLSLAISLGSFTIIQAQRIGQAVISIGSGTSNMDGWMEVRRDLDLDQLFGSRLAGNPKYSGIPPLWINGDLSIVDDFSMGLSISYQRQVATFRNASVYNESQDVTTVENVEWIGTRLNIGVRPLYHFGESDRLDGYFGVRIGYKLAASSHDASAPYAISDDLLEPTFPVGISPLFGFRVFFTDLLGANFELQLGNHIGLLWD